MKAKIAASLMVIGVLVCYRASAVDKYSTGTGNWDVNGTWSPSGVPGANDNVIIQNGHTVTYPSSFNSGNLTRGGSGSMTVNTGGTLNIAGTLTLSSGSFTMAGGTATIGTGFSSNGATFTGTSGTLNITTGTITIGNGGGSFTNNGATISIQAGNLTVTGSLTNGGIISLTNGILTKGNSGGSLTNTGTITVAGTGSNGVFNSNATVSNSGTINTKDFYTYNTGGTFTNTGFVNISGLASIAGSVVLNPGAGAGVSSRMTVTGTLSLSGSGMTVGNGVPGTPAKYADLVIQGNMAQTSHTITVNCNGRVAIFGDLNLNTGSNPQFTIATCSSGVGGQVYVDGDASGNTITVSDGAVNNNNTNVSGVPYGFYVNGPTTGAVDTDKATLSQMQTSNPSFYSWVASLPNSPLPIKLLYFKVVSIDESGVTLGWVTTMEKNFDYFEVQRAGTDLNFQTIGKLEGKGGFSVNTYYEAVDRTPNRGYNYYRLKAVDLDETFEYTNLISANWNLDRPVNIYPNPVKNQQFTIELNDRMTWPALIQLTDQLGSIVWQRQLDDPAGEIQLPENIKPGLYYARISSSHGHDVIALMIE